MRYAHSLLVVVALSGVACSETIRTAKEHSDLEGEARYSKALAERKARALAEADVRRQRRLDEQAELVLQERHRKAAEDRERDARVLASALAVEHAAEALAAEQEALAAAQKGREIALAKEQEDRKAEIVEQEDQKRAAIRRAFADGQDEYLLDKGSRGSGAYTEGEYDDVLVYTIWFCSRQWVHAFIKRNGRTLRKFGFAQMKCENAFEHWWEFVDAPNE